MQSDNKPWTVPPDPKEQNDTARVTQQYRTCFVLLDGQQWRKFRYTVQHRVHFKGSGTVCWYSCQEEPCVPIVLTAHSVRFLMLKCMTKVCGERQTNMQDQSCNDQQKNWSMTRPVIWLLLTGTTGCWNNAHTGKLYYAQISRPLTNDASDVIPHGQSVGLSLLPAVVVAQIERKPEEEGVVDQLQARVRQGILQCKKLTWCEQHAINSSRFVLCSCKAWTHRYHSGQEESLAEADGLRSLSRGFVQLLNWMVLLAVHFHLVFLVIYQRPVTFCVRLHRAKYGLGLHAQTWHVWVKRF